MRAGLQVKFHILLTDFNKIWDSKIRFYESFKYKILGNSTGMSLDKTCVRTDGHEEVKDAFPFYAKALTILLCTYKRFQGASRRKRDAGFVARLRINAKTLVVGKLNETPDLEDTHVDGRKC